MAESPTPRLDPRPEHDITLDQQVALRSAAARLAEAFNGTFNAETIEKFLAASYDEFAGRGVTDIRSIRDDIERRVLTLLAELGIVSTQHTDHRTSAGA